jgi:hypothetical protein
MTSGKRRFGKGATGRAAGLDVRGNAADLL